MPVNFFKNFILKPFFGLFLLSLGGCGYSHEVERLPGGASSIAIREVQNATHSSDLDVKLRGILRNRFLQTPRITFAPPSRSDLVLDVKLSSFTKSNAVSLTDTNISSLSARLKGTFILYQRGKVLIKKTTLNVTEVLTFAQATLETPSILDRLKNEAISSFADKLLYSVLNHF